MLLGDAVDPWARQVMNRTNLFSRRALSSIHRGRRNLRRPGERLLERETRAKLAYAPTESAIVDDLTKG